MLNLFQKSQCKLIFVIPHLSMCTYKTLDTLSRSLASLGESQKQVEPRELNILLYLKYFKWWENWPFLRQQSFLLTILWQHLKPGMPAMLGQLPHVQIGTTGGGMSDSWTGGWSLPKFVTGLVHRGSSLNCIDYPINFIFMVYITSMGQSKFFHHRGSLSPS